MNCKRESVRLGAGSFLRKQFLFVPGGLRLVFLLFQVPFKEDSEHDRSCGRRPDIRDWFRGKDAQGSHEQGQEECQRDQQDHFAEKR